jgi:hypothetical protein
MSHTPAQVATTNLMRTVGALSTSTQGFLALYTFRVWAYKCQSSLLTHLEHIGKGCPCRASVSSHY